MDENYSLEVLLSAVYHSLTTGGNMTAGNYAFTLICDKLGIEEDTLIFIYDTDWIHQNHEVPGSDVQGP